MSQKKWKSPLDNWEQDNQDPELAFTLVARNEAAKQMWTDPYNSSRYVPASFTRNGVGNRSYWESMPRILDSKNDDNQPKLGKKEDKEPALYFRFNNWPKNFAKGYVLGTCDKQCDALLGDPGDKIGQQTLAFTFNERHQLIMNVTSKTTIWVKFKAQKGAERKQFSWIFPRSQKTIRVKVADVLEFDVVLPQYGINKDEFHKNCVSFRNAAACGDPLVDNYEIGGIASTSQASATANPQESFYLRGKRLGSGAYGDVYKALRMPDGNICAAKRFKYIECFRQEVDILKKVCGTYHKNIVQFVEEWHEGYTPLLVMEYVAGGSLVQRIEVGMGFGEIANLANQTLAALEFLHGQGVMHRDIKPANILCVTPYHYKLADFGVSKEVAPLLSQQGTAEYMAPEVHLQGPYSYPADIWSLGVVLFECLYSLPNGRPGTAGRQWCEKLVSDSAWYYWKIEKSKPPAEDLDVILLVTHAMMVMNPNDRLSAWMCLQDYSHLWEAHCGEGSSAGSEANTPTQAHPNHSFSPNSLDESEGDELGGSSRSTAIWNGGKTPEEGRKPRNFRNEDRTTVATRGNASESFQGIFAPRAPSIGESKLYDPRFVLPWPQSIEGERLYDPSDFVPWSTSTAEAAEGTLYDPARVISSVPSKSESGTRSPSVSEGSTKRWRDSHERAEGVEDDGSVTPGRRAPYHPGNEVAAPGLDYLGVTAKRAEDAKDDGSVTPGRRAPYHAGNEVAAPGLDYFGPKR